MRNWRSTAQILQPTQSRAIEQPQSKQTVIVLEVLWAQQGQYCPLGSVLEVCGYICLYVFLARWSETAKH